jgi:hypothetical protein
VCYKSGLELEAGRFGVAVEYCYIGHILIWNAKIYIILHCLQTNLTVSHL